MTQQTYGKEVAIMPDYFDTGFTVRRPAWHGLGNVLDEHPTDWADAREKAGLIWEPEVTPSWVRKPTSTIKCRGCNAAYGIGGEPHADLCLVNETGTVRLGDCVEPGVRVFLSRGRDFTFIEDVDHQQILRSDTGAVLGAGLGKGYQPIYHGADAAGDTGASMEQVIDALMTDRAIRFETAGSVKGGKNVYALLVLEEPYNIFGDTSQTFPYLALLNSHDGSQALTALLSQIRVVCWNTFQACLAAGRSHGNAYSFRHSGDPRTRIEEARSALAGMRTEAADYRAMCEELSTLRVDTRIVDEFLMDFLPNPAEHGEIVTTRVQTNIDNARIKFRENYEESPTMEGIRGTGYGLFQASTEYLDHLRGVRSRDSYLGRSVLSADKAKAKALTLVREHATA